MDDKNPNIRADVLLLALHNALARCAQSWDVIAARRENVLLTADDAETMADFYARAAADAAVIAILTGVRLKVVPLDDRANPQPDAQGKPRLAVIEGGKS